MSDIQYEDIDPDIVDVIKLLNQNGLKTNFSCSGHKDGEPAYISFCETVTDEQILNLLSMLHSHNIDQSYRFEKWCRYVNESVRFDWTIKMPVWKIGKYEKENIRLFEFNKMYLINKLSEILRLKNER